MSSRIKVGTVVQFFGQSQQGSNGTRLHPAVVNRVWGDGEVPCLNLTVLPDCGEPFCATSVCHRSQVNLPIGEDGNVGPYASFWQEVA